MTNGRFWNILDDKGRMAYLSGVKDVVQLEFSGGVTGVNQKLWATQFSIDDYEKGITTFYSSPENGRIPITFALLYLTVKFQGLESDSQLADLLTDFRKKSNTPK